jgi:hypothetical protein
MSQCVGRRIGDCYSPGGLRAVPPTENEASSVTLTPMEGPRPYLLEQIWQQLTYRWMRGQGTRNPGLKDSTSPVTREKRGRNGDDTKFRPPI